MKALYIIKDGKILYCPNGEPAKQPAPAVEQKPKRKNKRKK